jgi:hypothetical protein
MSGFQWNSALAIAIEMRVHDGDGEYVEIE